MARYMVLFDPKMHKEEDYVPPPLVDGGIQGDTEKGIMAVYEVPEFALDAFIASLDECPSVLNLVVL